MVVRAGYDIIGNTSSSVSGPAGGLTLDLGQAWNFIGYAVTLTAKGAAVRFPETRDMRFAALLGAGPTITLGRLALVRRGLMDLRLGYDFLWAPTRRYAEDGTLIETPNLTPHGPRVHINMGLVTRPGKQRRFFRAIGLSVSYQALVGTFTGELPVSHILGFGLFYWLG